VRILLLVVHVAGAVLFLGPTTAATSGFARHVTAGNLDAARDARRITRTYGPASMVVPAVGIVLAATNGLLTELWVHLSLGLFVVAAVLVEAMHRPAQEAALTALEAGRTVEQSVHTRLRASAGGFALAWVIIVWLMVAKPS
jgi:uncharacterized membrane protein